MNLASILPCATVRPGGATGTATATTSAPAGFLDVLAAQTSTAGTALPLGEGELAEGGAEDGAAEDLLALAALASRTAHAALPQVLPTETTTAAPADASRAGVEPTVAPATAPTSPLAAADELVATVEDTVTTVPPVPGGEVPPADARTAEVPTADAGAAVPAPAADATDTVDQAPDVDVQGAAPSAATPATATAGRTDAAVPAQGADAAVPTEGADATAAGEELRAQPAAAPASPSERQRGRAEETPSRTGLEGARAVEGDATVAPAPVGGAAPGAGRADALTPSSAAQRVLDLVSQLEDAPPPRVVVIETGEIRLRIGLDAGTVRLTVLGQLGEAGEEILRETTDALEAGGFGTELDRGTGEGAERGRRHDAHDRDLPGAAGPQPARPGSRSRGGLQL